MITARAVVTDTNRIYSAVHKNEEEQVFVSERAGSRSDRAFYGAAKAAVFTAVPFLRYSIANALVGAVAVFSLTRAMHEFFDPHKQEFLERHPRISKYVFGKDEEDLRSDRLFSEYIRDRKTDPLGAIRRLREGTNALTKYGPRDES